MRLLSLCLALSLTASTASAEISKRDRLRVELGAGGRVSFGLPDTFEPRFSLMLSFFPRQLKQRFGIAFGLRAGSGLELASPIFTGRYDDVILALHLRSQIPFMGRFAFEPLAGIATHITILDAEVPNARVVRGIFALEAGAALGLDLSSGAQLALVVMVTWLTQTQRYLVGGVRVIEPYPLELDVGLRLRAGLW